MDKHEIDVARGEEAQRIVTSPVFVEAFEAVRANFIAALEILPTDESGDAEAKDIRRKLASLAMVRNALIRQIQTGQIAQKTLSAKERVANSARGAITSLLNRNRNR